jgi:GntR family transcriptional regulator
VVQHDTGIPPSQQVAADIRRQIRSGALAPGTRLPSIVALAAQYETTTSTIQKALKILKDEGLIASVPGYSTYVR